MKIRDMLMGIAIGDAFGVGVEFTSREWILDNIDFSKYINTRKGIYAEGYREGRYSDDTEMTIGLMNAMMDKRPFSEKTLLEYWKKEYDTFKKEKGIPRLGQGTIQKYYEGEESIDKVKSQNSSKKYPGNAPPMRAVPLGFSGDHMYEYAIINADATHPHPKARAASLVIAKAAEFMLVKDGEKENIISYCRSAIMSMDKETYDLLGRIDKLGYQLKESDYELICGLQPIPDFPVPNMFGLPADSMRTAAAALHTLKYSESPFDTLKRSVQYGGDVDSLAAITTGIMAGKYGLDNLPVFMQEKIEDREILENLAIRFDEFLNSKNLKRSLHNFYI